MGVRAAVGDCFTMGTPGTLSGSVALLTILVNALCDAPGVGFRPLTLGIAVLISVVTSWFTTTATGERVAAVLNGFQIYGTAYGADTAFLSDATPAASRVEAAPTPDFAPVARPDGEDPRPVQPKVLIRRGPFGNLLLLEHE